MEINSNHSTYGAAFRQKPIFFMSGKETVAYFEGKLKKNMTLQEDTCTLGSNEARVPEASKAVLRKTL